MNQSFSPMHRWLLCVCSTLCLLSLVHCAPLSRPCGSDNKCSDPQKPHCVGGECKECDNNDHCVSKNCRSDKTCAPVGSTETVVPLDGSEQGVSENRQPNESVSPDVTEESVPELQTEPAPEPQIEAVPEAFCVTGTIRSCYPSGKTGCSADTGEKYTCKGICATGIESCVNGAWSGQCIGATESSVELCNGRDDDCDGQIDNGFANLGQSCDVGKGECKATGKFVCKTDGSGTECDARPGTPTAEICDKKDNNCDGSVDEGCPCVLGDTQPCGSDKGECKKGTQTCDIHGKWGTCSGEIKPFIELCNGKDDDCDGVIDNGFTNLGQSCDIGQGECKATGKYVCKSDGFGTVCDAKLGTSGTEVCDGKDNDCNGNIDESFPEYQKVCTVMNQQGECAKGTYTACSQGKLVCSGPSPQTETCNGKDDDCDGQIDNHCGFFWAASAGGTSQDRVQSIATDSAGNLYIAGDYEGTAVFGSTTLSSQGNSDVFVAKLSNQGVLLWAVSAGGTTNDYVYSITTDSVDNLYITGIYVGTAVFGSTTLSSQGHYDVFVAKLSNQGAFLWAVSSGGTSVDYANSITTDSAGNLYITGSYRGAAVFGSTTLSSQGSGSVFIAKLSNQGTFLWAVSSGGTTDSCYVYSITTDSTGNLYINGYYQGAAVFGSTTLSSQGSRDMFVVKLSDQGTFLWVVPGGADVISSIATDSAGNLYITGSYSRIAVFGSTTLSSQGSRDVFVAKLSDQGTFLWAVSSGGIGDGVVSSIATDSAGNLYIAGYYKGTAVFGSTILSSQAGFDVFVAKLSNQGMFLWAVSAKGASDNYAISIATDSKGNLYITGFYQGIAIFGSSTLFSQGKYDVFVAKLR